ncbi:MAG TPA: hypothetical protein VF374_04275 [Thermoplasmata archaeon]
MGMEHRETDLSRYTRRMHGRKARALHHKSQYPHCDLPKTGFFSWVGFPFASISVLVILLTLFAMSMIRGGWSWSSWTYAFSFAILVPLIALEVKRKAVISGGAVLLLFFMVLIDAGMPGMFGYSPSDFNWYDNMAHFLGALVLTLFLWSFLWWTISPAGPPKENGHRKFLLTIVVMIVISVIFEFTEFFSDILFGWSNFHPGIDTMGDLIFDIAGILTAGFAIGRHRVSAIKRPFWHADFSPA